jgi:aspartyl aminopeptidase
MRKSLQLMKALEKELIPVIQKVIQKEEKAKKQNKNHVGVFAAIEEEKFPVTLKDVVCKEFDTLEEQKGPVVGN